MNCIFSPLLFKIIILYFDNVIPYSSDIERHFQHLQETFDILRDAGISLKRQKCKFFKRSITILGFVVSANGIQADPEKTRPIDCYPIPCNIKDVQSFLGLCGVYRMFISCFAIIAAPLYYLTKKDIPFVWAEEADSAFRTLKVKLVSPPVLAHPDFTRPFEIHSDAACTIGIGVILCQRDDNGHLHPIAFASRSLSPPEKNYHVTELEALAFVWALRKKFHHFVAGSHFHIFTDHSALQFLHKNNNLTGRLARWSLTLQQYHYTIHYIPGRNNQAPDALSRHPLPTTSAVYPPHITPIESPEHLKEQQHLDPFCSKIIEELADRPSYRLIRGILHRIHIAPHNPSRPIFQIVAPPIFHPFIFFQSHDIPLSAHLGRAKTLHRVLSQYWWPSVYEDVKNYVQHCETCQSVKLGRQQQEAQYPTTSSAPFRRIAADFFGPLPTSTEGNRYIVVLQDMFTRYVDLIPLKTTQVREFFEVLTSKYFTRHGIPQEILSDNGIPFGADEYHHLVQLLNITPRFAPAYHPQSNGQVERFMASLRNMIASYLENKHDVWDRKLSKLAFAYNTTFHSGIQDTPFFFTHGRDPRHPLNAIDSIDLEKMLSQGPNQRSDYFKELYEAQNRAVAMQEATLQPPRDTSDWLVGTAVWLYTPPTSRSTKTISPKFMKPWTGPWRIIAVRSHNSRDLMTYNGDRQLNIHTSRLKRYFEATGPGPIPSEIPSMDPALVPLPPTGEGDVGI
jgi:hypothetical protein